MSEVNKPAFGGSYDHVLIDTTGRNPPQKIEYRHPGLTKREYYAAKAMQGLLSSYTNGEDPDGYEQPIARFSFGMADAMLSETERHNDMLALVERVAELNIFGDERAADVIEEARRILGRSEEKS